MLSDDRLLAILKHEATNHGATDYKHSVVALILRLRAEVEALKATCKQHLQVQRYELVYDEMQEDDDGDWVRWIDIESALRGEGE